MIFALLDHETTGLTAHFEASINIQPKVIEIGMLLTDGKEIIEEYNQLINPKQKLEEVITKITGITDEQLIDAPVFGDVVSDIGKIFKKADVVLAHNMSFDKAIMTYELKRERLELSAVNWPRTELCTVEQTYPKYGRRMKLEELYNIHVGEIVQTHRAVDDCKMLNEVCKKIGVFDVFSTTQS